MKIVFFRKIPKFDFTNTLFRITGKLPFALRSAALAATLSAMLIASVPAKAQSCGAPGQFPSTLVSPLTDTTCGHEQVSPVLCDGIVDNPGPNYVIEFRVARPGGRITISGSGSFVPTMYLSRGHDSCISAPCVAVGGPSNPMSLVGLPAGPYRLTISAQPDDPAGTCGFFSVIGDKEFYNGQEDVIFADGVE